MYTDGGRGLPSDYNLFLREKRSQTKSKQLPKPSVPAHSSSVCEDLDSWRPAGPSFTDTLQLNLGRRAVENGQLTVRVLQLESELSERAKEANLKCQEIETLQATVESLKAEISRSQTDSSLLTGKLCEATENITVLESQKSALSDKPATRDLENSVPLRDLETLCDSLRRENSEMREFYDEKLAAQREEFETDLARIRSNGTQRGEANFEQNALGERLTDSLAELQIDKSRLRENFQTVTAQIERLKKLRLTDTEKIREAQDKKCQLERELTSLRLLHNQTINSLRTDLSGTEKVFQDEREKTIQLTEQLTVLQDDVQNQVRRHQKERDEWQQKFSELTVKSEAAMSQSLKETEQKLRDSELERKELVREFGEQTEQGRKGKEFMQAEYKKRIAELENRYEEDYRRRTRQAEEQAKKEVLEWKSEYEKVQTTHQQYMKMVDTRLEEHKKTISDRFNSEITQLNHQIQTLQSEAKSHQAEILTLQQKKSAKEIELKSANGTIAGLHKKIANLEARLKETSDLNETLSNEISSLKRAKDPSTIVQITLQEERAKLQAVIDREYEHASIMKETHLKAQFQEQFEEQKTRHKQVLAKLSEQLKSALDDLTKEKMENLKSKDTFAEKKRSLEERLASFSQETDSQLKALEQKFQLEIRNLKAGHEKALKQWKTEKAALLKKNEDSHKMEMEAVVSKQKSDLEILLRKHQDNQRELLASISKDLRKNVGLEYGQEIRKLQMQISEAERVKEEQERRWNDIMRENQEQHERSIKVLEVQNLQTAEKAHQTEATIGDLRELLKVNQDQFQQLRDKVAREVTFELEKRHVEQQNLVQMAGDSARQNASDQLLAYQRASALHVQQLANELQTIQCDMRKSQEIEEDLRRQLNQALTRNHDLECCQMLVQQRLRQAANGPSESRVF